VSTALDTESVVVVLADSGEGIAEDQIDLIFDPMFSTKRRHGTGLVLTIVKQIISEHNGDVEVESDPGRQTTFRIRLPLDAAVASTKAGTEASYGTRASRRESLEVLINDPTLVDR